ncbi:hypothetical protein H8S90_13870 [Olivibacter sp. SDN3]|uniref:hypothetical protein n=1 Tax=Olivibacter sp. SDN3 TaxID=2764720 RepID=UPI001650D4A0|nr:hypothetical protein [Olivibacter sp. SDN3]QNL47906.1 hypothetical protein H8S90_13870 [Olivibacter sp. SDN3]
MNNFFINDGRLFRSLRITLACVLALPILYIIPDFNNLYGPAGWVNVKLLSMQQSFPGYAIHHLIGWISAKFPISHQASCMLLIWVYCGLCILLALGYAMRLASLALLTLHLSIFVVMKPYSYGADHISTSLLFYLVLLPKRADFYCWLYIQTVRIHLCIVYFFGGLVKSLGNNWWNGEALWKALNLPYFNQYFQWDFDWLTGYPSLLLIGGVTVIVLELLYPFAMFNSYLRKPWLGAVILMHLIIAIVLNLLVFSLFMIVWNVAAFVVGNHILRKYYQKNSLNFKPSRWWRAKGAPVQDQQA